jgi:hypothetical protein
MRIRRPRFVRCSMVVVLLLWGSTAAAAAKGTAKHPAASTDQGSSSDASSSGPGSRTSSEKSSTTTDESSEASPPPSAASTSSISPSDEPSASASPDEAAKAGTPASGSPEEAKPASASVAEEPKPASESLPIWVEHLGPSSYPGKLRGLYGGSLWLEPSFHGLQWPTMAKSGVGVSGWFWVDSGYEQVNREHPRLGNTVMWLQQGRGVLRVTPTYTSGKFFIQAQVELVGNQCQQAGGTTSSCQTFGTFDTDDLWIRLGHWNIWDFKVGRYEAWEIYHTGMGLDINTMERQGATMGPIVPGNIAAAPAFYAVNYLHDRPSAGLGVGYAALHWYPTSNLRVEGLGELGTDDSTGAGYVYYGVRPTAILDLGVFKAKVGAEYEKQAKSTQKYDANTQAKVDDPEKRIRKGVGGALQVVLDPWVEFGVNGALGEQARTNYSGNSDGQGTFTTTSVGGFINARLARLLLVGVGVNWTTQTDSYYVNGSSYPDHSAHLQAFGAVQYLLAGQLYARAVFGWSRADFEDSDQSIPIWSNYMYSARIRLMYLY